MPRASRLVPVAFAAISLLGACGSDDDGTAEQPVPTASAPTPSTTPAPAPEPIQTTAPLPSTSSPLMPVEQRYEVIESVIDEGHGARLCFDVLDSLPPQCGTGLTLNGWSWDDITVEQSQNGVTWVDSIYVNGKYDDAAQAFDVESTGIPSDEDRERLLLSRPLPDFRVPCPAPAGGWPESQGTDWATDAISQLDGYAGSWIEESQQVLTVKFTGDLAAAESAVREHFSNALCVVGAEHSQAELSAIQQQLLGLSSTQVLGSAIYVDASGEWVEAMTIAPDPARQSALDAEFGEGVVRLRPMLHPIATS